MVGTWKYGPSGHAIDCPVPRPEQVHVEDIAHALGQVPRFGGMAREQFSVAQHTVEVGALCVQRAIAEGRDPVAAGIAGISHDFHEAYVGDVITPIKKRLGHAWSELDSQCTRAVRVGLDLDRVIEPYHDLVEWADAEMLVSDVARWCYPGRYVSRLLGEFDVLGDGSPSERMTIHAPHLLRYENATCWEWRKACAALIRAWHCLKSGTPYELDYAKRPCVVPIAARRE